MKKSQNNNFDYIICGGGCAGLSLAFRLTDPFFSDKRILLIEKDPKEENDRTWCFWEKNESHDFYNEIISNQWANIRIANYHSRFIRALPFLKYNRIRAVDYYDFTKERISQSSNIKLVRDEIIQITETKEGIVKVICKNGTFVSELCFSSIPKEVADSSEYDLKQHFLGWEVEYDRDVFDIEIADLMDFRMPQYDEVRFVYILPFSNNRALIEFTVFSEKVFDSIGEYESYLIKYLEMHYPKMKYKILDSEYGIIPMSTRKYYHSINSRVIPIGNLSGRIKPSTGYAFKRIQEETKSIIYQLKNGSHQISIQSGGRFLFYDKILFNVMTQKRMLGADIFTMLFEKNDPALVLRFLDEKTTLLDEVKLFSSLPTIPFMKGMISECIRRLFYK